VLQLNVTMRHLGVPLAGEHTSTVWLSVPPLKLKNHATAVHWLTCIG